MWLITSKQRTCRLNVFQDIGSFVCKKIRQKKKLRSISDHQIAMLHQIYTLASCSFKLIKCSFRLKQKSQFLLKATSALFCCDGSHMFWWHKNKGNKEIACLYLKTCSDSFHLITSQINSAMPMNSLLLVFFCTDPIVHIELKRLFIELHLSWKI